MKKWSEEELIAAGYKIQNAQITNADLSTENYCCCDFPITLDGDGWGVVYGGYVLGKGGTAFKIDEIVNNPILKNIELGIDGGRATLHIGGWDGSVIWSWDCGFEHVSVAPFAKRITPSWDDMTKIKDIFWNDDEAVIQIHPKKADYVNNLENCLHLWRCTYKEMPLPPSCLVGIREGQTQEEFNREVREAYEMAGEKY